MAVNSSNPTRFVGANRTALIIVGVLSLLGLAYAIARVDILRARIVVLHTDLDQTRAEQSNLATQLHTVQALQQQHFAQLQQAQDTLNHFSSGLNRQVTQATQQWTRAEVLYLTRLAQDQLQHAHDTDGARNTLNASLTRSQAQPGVIPETIQQQLQNAVAALSALPANQHTQIEMQLHNAETQVAQLPLASARHAINAASSSNSAWQTIQQAISQLILVRRSGEQASMLVSDQDALLQRQYLSQQLLAARLAADRHDQQAYLQALMLSVRCLEQIFDAHDATTQALRTQLIKLQDIQVAPTLPDLSNSIAALQALFNQGVTP